MCFSFQESIRSFTFSFILSTIKIFNRHNNHPHDFVTALFIIVFSLVQLIEACMWKFYDSNKKILKLCGYLVKPTILLQPLTISFGMRYLLQKENKNLFVINLISALSLLICINYMIKLRYKNIKFPTIGPNNHLQWDGISYDEQNISLLGIQTKYLYILTVFIPAILYLQPLRKRFMFLTFYSITFLLSKYFYEKSNEEPSYWCYIANFSAFFQFL